MMRTDDFLVGDFGSVKGSPDQITRVSKVGREGKNVSNVVVALGTNSSSHLWVG